MKRLIRFLSSSMLAVSTAFTLFVPSIVSAEANTNVETHATGGIYSPPEELPTSDFGCNDDQEYDEYSDNSISARSVPSSYDITTNVSTAKYFPEIGDQGEIGSCTSWASTYYQFTYEVNKLRKITTTPSNTYSPTWTYNYTNGGEFKGTSIAKAYEVLMHHGAMTLSDLPYIKTKSNYSFDWPTNEEKLLEALHYRCDPQSFSVTSSKQINLVKNKLYSGHVLTFHTYAYGWNEETNSSGEIFEVSCTKAQGGHYVTVVGYDDDIQITVNGTTLTGAFKVANSWGKNWGNEGYFWMPYDALNETSQYTTGWDSAYGGSRRSMVSDGVFYYITPYKCPAEVCEIVRFASTHPWSISAKTARGTNALQKKWNAVSMTKSATASTRYLAFDYAGLGGSYITSAILSCDWKIQLAGNTTANSTYHMAFHLVDSKNNDIEPFNYTYYTLGSSGIFTMTHTSSLARGRISSYDNHAITSADAKLLQNYLLGNTTFSSLQYKLADYNGDGSVDGADLIKMRSDIASANGISLSEESCLFEMEKDIADDLAKQNATFEEFLSGSLVKENAA